MLSKAKHPSGKTTTINATGIPHFIRNDMFPGKVGRAETFKLLLCYDGIALSLSSGDKLLLYFGQGGFYRLALGDG